LSERTRELLLIGGLIAGTLGLGFGLIPAGIEEGFGSRGAGLSPRAMPQVAVAGILLALTFGLLQMILAKSPNDATPATGDKSGDHLLRAAGAVLICLLFAYIGFNAFGFYLGGVAMAAALTLLLGERKVLYVLLLPILILAVIYGLFELGFQIKLPKSDFIPGLPI
jgi:hypothetical protein